MCIGRPADSIALDFCPGARVQCNGQSTVERQPRANRTRGQTAWPLSGRQRRPSPLPRLAAARMRVVQRFCGGRRPLVRPNEDLNTSNKSKGNRFASKTGPNNVDHLQDGAHKLPQQDPEQCWAGLCPGRRSCIFRLSAKPPATSGQLARDEHTEVEFDFDPAYVTRTARANPAQ
jgi:hypothetical protein